MYNRVDAKIATKLISGLSEIAALEASLSVKKHKFMETLRIAFDAEFWLWSFWEFQEEMVQPRIYNIIHNAGDCIVSKEDVIEYFSDQECPDPTYPILFEKIKTQDQLVFTREDFIPTEAWHQMEHYKKYIGRFGLDHLMVCYNKFNQKQATAVALNRAAGKPNFTAEEKELFKLVINEIQWIQDGLYELAEKNSTMLCLSNQQYRVLQYILQGFEDKQIAHSMFLSVETIRDYVKQLRKHFNCETRNKLIARFIPTK